MKQDKLQDKLQHYLKENKLTNTFTIEIDSEYTRIKLIKPALVFNEKTQEIEEQMHGLKIRITDDAQLTFDTVIAAINALLRIAKQKFLL